MFLFETPCDLRLIMCFNIITKSKCYNLFPILSSLIEPNFHNFIISLANGLFSPIGIGRSIPSLRTVLESFLPHTAHQSFILMSHFNLPYPNKIVHKNSCTFSILTRFWGIGVFAVEPLPPPPWMTGFLIKSSLSIKRIWVVKHRTSHNIPHKKPCNSSLIWRR